MLDTFKENKSQDPKISKLSNSRGPLTSLNLSTVLNRPQVLTDSINKDPQLLLEYVADIFVNLKSQENQNLISCTYMTLQNDLNAKSRAVLVDWVVSIHRRFKLQTETLHLCVSLIDRFLGGQKITRNELQLVGVTSLFIAAKYEEIYPPELKDFISLTDHACSREMIVIKEREILASLEYMITFPSAWRFFERYSDISNLNAQGRSLGQYLLELSIIEYHMLKYKESVKAASAVYLGHKIFHKEYIWNIDEDDISQSEIKQCATDLLVLMQVATKHPLTAVKEKFGRPQFHDVSSLRLS